MIRISDRYKGDWATSGEKWELYWYRDAGLYAACIAHSHECNFWRLASQGFC